MSDLVRFYETISPLGEPYYDDGDGRVVFCGDCRELLPLLPDGAFDSLVTDPPYGICEADGKNKSRGNLAQSRDYGAESWDDETCESGVFEGIRLTRLQVIFGGNYYRLPPSSCWLVWDKENGNTDFADCELAWTNRTSAVRIKRHLWSGMRRKNGESRVHPTQKPLDVIRWAAGFTEGTILDPFIGSGTTLVAAKQLGRFGIGIELEERYCGIAKQRLRQKVLF